MMKIKEIETKRLNEIQKIDTFFEGEFSRIMSNYNYFLVSNKFLSSFEIEVNKKIFKKQIDYLFERHTLNLWSINRKFDKKIKKLKSNQICTLL